MLQNGQSEGWGQCPGDLTLTAMDGSVKLASQGVPVRPEPHSDRPAVSFPGAVGCPGTPCGGILRRRCLWPEKVQTVWSRDRSVCAAGASFAATPQVDLSNRFEDQPPFRVQGLDAIIAPRGPTLQATSRLYPQPIAVCD